MSAFSKAAGGLLLFCLSLAAQDMSGILQAAINNACAQGVEAPGAPGGSVHLSGNPNGYLISRPLVISCSNLRFTGEYLNSLVKTNYTYGPALVIHPPIGADFTAVPTTTALIAGGGAAMVLGARNYLNLSDAISVNGLAQLTVELFVTPTTTPVDTALISSSGSRGAYNPMTRAFWVGSIAGNLQASITLASGTYALSTSVSFVSGTRYHIALSYDGTTIRLYANGVLAASTAATGAVVQPETENMTVGSSLAGWPLGAPYNGGMLANIDAIQVSDIARYTSAFTPKTAKTGADSHTLAVLNFDQQFDAFTTMHSALGDGYLLYRQPSSVTFLSEVDVEDIAIQDYLYNNGIIAWHDVNGLFRHVEVINGRSLLSLENNNYETTVEQFVGRAGMYTIYDVLLANASGVFKADRLKLFGGHYQLVTSGDLSLTVTDSWFQTESATILSIAMLGGGDPSAITSLRDNKINSESGGASLAALMLISNMVAPVSLYDNYFEGLAAIPSIIVQGGGQINITGGRFVGSDSSVPISIPVAPSIPVNIIGITRSQVSTALSDLMASVKVW